MAISSKIYEDRKWYHKKYKEYLVKLFKCGKCINKCDDSSIELNYEEYIVDKLDECPCFGEKDARVWTPGVTIKSDENCIITLIEKKDDFDRTVIIENGQIVQKPDDIDILGKDTPFGFEIRGLRKKIDLSK